MCRTDFERRIYHDSYQEFYKKSKIYSLNQTVNTFADMQAVNGKASSLHQKLNYAVMNTIGALENKMPLLNATNGDAVLFDLAELEIYSSDLLNKAAHVVCINYTSPKLVLHEIIGDLLILSYDAVSNENTFMVKMTDEVAINYEQSSELAYS